MIFNWILQYEFKVKLLIFHYFLELHLAKTNRLSNPTHLNLGNLNLMSKHMTFLNTAQVYPDFG